MRILITGVIGFAGAYLADQLARDEKNLLFGFSRTGVWPASLQHLAGRVTLEPCDWLDVGALATQLHRIGPDQIYHLAGYAHAGQSFGDAEAAWTGNLSVTRSLYDAVAKWGGRPRLLYVSSGLIYGESASVDHAHDETCPLLPASPYAASKAAADLASYQWSRVPGLDIVRARPFNHAGPRQAPTYAVASFARQIAAIERDLQPPLLKTGSLTPLRDLTDVRDVAQAYTLLMEKGRSGEAYNIASGQLHSMREVVDALLTLARVPIRVEQQAELIRPAETSVIRGNSAKLRGETGWVPRIGFTPMLTDILNHWRSHS